VRGVKLWRAPTVEALAHFSFAGVEINECSDFPSMQALNTLVWFRCSFQFINCSIGLVIYLLISFTALFLLITVQIIDFHGAACHQDIE